MDEYIDAILDELDDGPAGVGPAGSRPADTQPADAQPPYTATITFSHCTESHAGTAKHGAAREAGGWGKEHIDMGAEWARARGLPHEVYELHRGVGPVPPHPPREAYVLVLRGAAGPLMAGDAPPAGELRALEAEYRGLIPRLDRKFVNFRRVTRKKARANGEIGDAAVESTLRAAPLGMRLERGAPPLTGVVFPFRALPALSRLRRGLPAAFGGGAAGLLAEINHYGPTPGAAFPEKECGIGFHGDGERSDVIGVVLGSVRKELHFQAFVRTRPVGRRVVVTVGPADVYMMCEAACGYTWAADRRRDVVHYRHAAGCLGGNRFTPPPEKLLKTYAAKERRKAGKKEARSL